MSTIAFNSLEITRKLRDAGFDESLAVSVVRALVDAQYDVVTRDYLDTKIDVLRVEISHTRWMIAALVALSIANFVLQS